MRNVFLPGVQQLALAAILWPIEELGVWCGHISASRVVNESMLRSMRVLGVADQELLSAEV